jgi:hypothetical protein
MVLTERRRPSVDLLRRLRAAASFLMPVASVQLSIYGPIGPLQKRPSTSSDPWRNHAQTPLGCLCHPQTPNPVWSLSPRLAKALTFKTVSTEEMASATGALPLPDKTLRNLCNLRIFLLSADLFSVIPQNLRTIPGRAPPRAFLEGSTFASALHQIPPRCDPANNKRLCPPHGDASRPPA